MAVAIEESPSLGLICGQTWEYVTDPDRLVEVVRFFKGYRKSFQDSIIGVDTETYCPEEAKASLKRLRPIRQVPIPVWDGHNWLSRVRLLQLGTDPVFSPAFYRDKQFLLDVMYLGADIVGAAMKDLLEHSVILGHNLKYDDGGARTHLGIEMKRGSMLDTMLMNKTLKAGIKTYGHSLMDVYRQEIAESTFMAATNKSFDEYEEFKDRFQKKEDWSIPDLTEDHLQYGADDCRLIFLAYHKLIDKLDNWVSQEREHKPGCSLEDRLREELELIPTVSMMEIRGFPFSKERHETKIIPFLQAKSDEEEEILLSYPEFELEPPKGTDWINIVNRTSKIDAAVVASNLRKLVTMNFKKHSYTYQEGDSEPKLKVCAVNTERNDEYGDQVWITWRLIEPKVSRDEILNDIVDVLPAGYEVRDRVPINLRSNDDLKDSLFKRLGKTIVKAEAKYLRHFMEDDPDVISSILRYKSAAKALSTYGVGLVKRVTDRGFIHANYNQMGSDNEAVSTGRFSSSDPNGQNYPKKPLFANHLTGDKGWSGSFLIRDSFIAPPGFLFVGSDLSQIEPRLTAQFTGDKRLIEALNNGEDLHGLLAKKVLSLSYVPLSGTFERDVIGKTMNLAIGYGIGDNSLAEYMFVNTDGQVVWSRKDAKKAIDSYFALYPGIKQAMDEMRYFIMEGPCAAGTLSGYKGRRPFATVTAPCGRIRHFALTAKQEAMPDFMLDADFGGERSWNDFKQRLQDAALAGYNFRIQGWAATVMKKALIGVDKAVNKLIKDPYAEGIISTIHDEVILLVRSEIAAEVAEITKFEMEKAGSMFLTKVQCVAKVKIAKSWGRCA